MNQNNADNYNNIINNIQTPYRIVFNDQNDINNILIPGEQNTSRNTRRNTRRKTSKKTSRKTSRKQVEKQIEKQVEKQVNNK